MAKRGKPASQKDKDPQKVADKRARREERKIREAAAKRRALRLRRMKFLAGWVVAGLVVLGIGFVVVGELFPAELAGVERVASDGRSHLAAGQTAGYASAAPTSGPHSPNSINCGIYRQAVSPEQAVHALEHGTVVIWYQDGLSAEEIDLLQTAVNEFDNQVILAPNAALADPVIATSWDRRKSYDAADPEIGEFISTYRNRGPERVPCNF